MLPMPGKLTATSWGGAQDARANRVVPPPLPAEVAPIPPTKGGTVPESTGAKRGASDVDVHASGGFYRMDGEYQAANKNKDMLVEVDTVPTVCLVHDSDKVARVIILWNPPSRTSGSSNAMT